MRPFYLILLSFGLLITFPVSEIRAQASLGISLERSNASLSSGNTFTYEVRASVSNQNASNMVIWIKLPDNGSADLIYPTAVHPEAPYPEQNDQLQFVSSLDGGLYTSTQLTVSGKTIPANSVYWNLGNVNSGIGFIRRATIRIKVGTLNATQFKSQAFAVADNAAQIASSVVTVSSIASPNYQLSQNDNFLVFNGAKYLNYGGTGLFGLRFSGNSTLGVESVYKARIYEDLTNIIPLIEDGGNGIQLLDFINHSEGAVFDPAFIPAGSVTSFPAIYWDVPVITPGTPLDRSFNAKIKEKAEFENPPQSFERKIGIRANPNLSLSTSGNVNLGINETPSFSFALGERYLGLSQISSSNNDLLNVSVPIGGTYSGLLRISNTGLVALNNILLFNKIPIGTEFSNAFLPTNANGLIFYSTTTDPNYTPTNPPPVDISKLPLSLNPDGNSIWESFIDNPPADNAAVTWVVFYVPKLVSSFFPENNLPVTEIGEVELKGKLDDPCVSQIANNVAFARVLGKSFDGGEIESINLSLSDSDPMPIVPDSPTVTISSNFLSAFYSANSTATLRVVMTNSSTSPSVIKSPILEIASDPIGINGVPGYLDVTSVSIGTIIDNQPGLVKIQLDDQAINSSRTVDIRFAVPEFGIKSNSIFTVNSTLSWTTSCPPNSVNTSRSVTINSQPTLSVFIKEIPEFTNPGATINLEIEVKSIGNAPATKSWTVTPIPDPMVFEKIGGSEFGKVYFSETDFGDFKSFSYPVVSENYILSNFTLGTYSDNGTPADKTDDYWTSPFGENTNTVAVGLDDLELSLFPTPTTKNLILTLRNDKDRGSEQLDSQVGETATFLSSIFSNELFRAVSNERKTTFLTNPIPDFQQECLVEFEDLPIPTAEDPIYGTLVGTTDLNLFPITKLGKTTIQWVFEANGEVLKTKPQNIFVTDGVAPEPNLAVLPKIEQSCSVAFGDLEIPTATDNCKGQIQGTTSTAIFPITSSGDYQITWIFNDGNGNSTSQIQDITLLIDDIPPTIIAPERKVIVLDNEFTYESIYSVDLGEPQVSDNCGIASVVKSSLNFYLITGINLVTWTVTDTQGNKGVGFQEVEVRIEGNNQKFQIPSELVRDNFEGMCGAIITGLEELIVAVPETSIDEQYYINGGFGNDNPTYFPVGETIVYYFISYNNYQNYYTFYQRIIVNDLEPPLITAPADIIISIEGGGNFAANVNLGQPEFSDNCEGVSVSNDAPDIFSVGVTIVTWTATDKAGNTSTATQSVTVDGDEDCTTAFYIDADGDGFGDGNSAPIIACEAPAGRVANNQDCDDTNPLINPAAPELCDGLDNNCNGIVDDVVSPDLAFYPDADGDGYGDSEGEPIFSCVAPEGYVDNNLDCDDTDLAINPSAKEILDGKDNNCNGLIDGDDPTFEVLYAFYPDEDGDGFGAKGSEPEFFLTRPAGYSENDDDCDDTDSSINPEATELCDGIDNNCNGLVDAEDPDIVFDFAYYPDLDGDGFGDSQAEPVYACEAPEGHVDNNGDCDDSDPTVNPLAEEIPDGKDNNCNGLVDFDDPALSGMKYYYPDMDGDGFGDGSKTPILAREAPEDHVANNQDCDDTDPLINPAAPELCDGLDNNCNGIVDDADAPDLAFYPDADGDGYGDSEGEPIFSCVAPEGYVLDNTDCDDTDPLINPGILGTCNTDPCDEPVEVISISGPLDPIQVNNPISVSAHISGDVLEAKWIWDNGQETVLSAPFGDFAAQYTYSTPGVYQISLVLVDACGNETIGLTDLAVIFDPNGGFITGGGWIWSPKGAYQLDKNVEGRANFGFVAKYKKGSQKVDGNTEFQFRNGNLNFHSSSYEDMTLVIAGQKAIYKGNGRINQKSGYSFMVSAIDENQKNGKKKDKFRIKIWETLSGKLVYDNQLGSSDNADASTSISGGSIVIHQPQKGKNKSIDPSGIVQVAWNTPFKELKDYTVLYELEEETVEIMVDWNEEDYDPLVPGIYEISGRVKQLNTNRIIPVYNVSMYVLVLDKPMPQDITMSNVVIDKNQAKGQVIGTLDTKDLADDIHEYRLDPSADFELDGNQVIWIGEGELRHEYSISVSSIDRVGQSISREIRITREIGANQVTIYPNPASKETNIKVDLNQANEVSIRVFDAAGRLVFEESGNQERGFIRNVNLQTLSAGLYQVQVQIGFETITKRLVKVE